ncbi:acyltransferase [Streptomyces sp. NPDC041068]|uniref:acyltransferase family protein n=1 Tax=Streptomyces sp. NPDC041068 TaxID=3155130 RepID=UPI0033EC4CDE
MTVTPAAPARPTSVPPAHRRRHIAPLDGLRGVAVLGVLFFHAGHFGGGFLGVDLFFVLSGYLITGLLLKEAAGTGRIDLVAFWGRRARRLLPALATAVAGTLALVWAFGPPQLLRFALDDTTWVVSNLANWHFIGDRLGYWNGSDTRVFSHLWSIAVEEQFYLVWPLVLCLVVRSAKTGARGTEATGARSTKATGARSTEATGARSTKAGTRVALAAGTGALASLGLMVALAAPASADTTRVYEGTDTRAFSLLLGALMATPPATGLLSRLGERTTGRICLIPACAIGAYWALSDGQKSPSLFRGGLFLHALAAALLIACLARTPDGPVGRALGSAPLRWTGLVSYSLYLWHWPVFVLLGEERLGLTGWPRTAVVIAVSFAAAWLSKVLVEDPIRFRARWAKGHAGAFALVGVFAALLSLWAAVPEPRTGQGSVDITRLTSDDG